MKMDVLETTVNDGSTPSGMNISARFAMESFFPGVPIKQTDFMSIWGWQEGNVTLQTNGNVLSESNPASELEIEIRWLSRYLTQRIIFRVGHSRRMVTWGFPDLVDSPNYEEEWPNTIEDPEVADDIRKIVHTQYTELFPYIKHEIWGAMHKTEFEFMHDIGFSFPQYHMFRKDKYATIVLQHTGTRFCSRVTYNPLLTGANKPL